MAWELCSKQDVINMQPVSEDELKDQWSNEVEWLIRQYKGTLYLGTSQVITNEYHSGEGTTTLRVKHPPIISVQAVRINDVLITESDYVVFSNHIQLKAYTFPDGILNVQIDYTSGNLTVDPGVKLTAVAMILAIVNYYRRMGADTSIRFGNPENKVGEETLNRNPGLTSHLIIIMKRLLRRDKVRAC
jgi:hypothetical protein